LSYTLVPSAMYAGVQYLPECSVHPILSVGCVDGHTTAYRGVLLFYGCPIRDGASHGIRLPVLLVIFRWNVFSMMRPGCRVQNNNRFNSINGVQCFLGTTTVAGHSGNSIWHACVIFYRYFKLAIQISKK
jgi:hypothetical protein